MIHYLPYQSLQRPQPVWTPPRPKYLDLAIPKPIIDTILSFERRFMFDADREVLRPYSRIEDLIGECKNLGKILVFIRELGPDDDEEKEEAFYYFFQIAREMGILHFKDFVDYLSSLTPPIYINVDRFNVHPSHREVAAQVSTIVRQRMDQMPPPARGHHLKLERCTIL